MDAFSSMLIGSANFNRNNQGNVFETQMGMTPLAERLRFLENPTGNKSEGETAIPSLLEEMFRNTTLSLVTQARLIPSEPLQASIETQAYRNVYTYSVTALWIAYGVAVGIIVLSIAIGSRAVAAAGSSYSSRFSTILRLASNIVVERLTKNINEGHLEEIFGQYGPIKDLDLPINRTYGTNRGTAYILYEHEADAEEAIAHMHEAQIDGAVINVSIVLPRRKLSPPPPMARRGAGYDPRLPAPGGRGNRQGAHGGASGPGPFGHSGPRRGGSPPPGRFGSRSDNYRPRSLSRSPSRSPVAAPPSRGGGGSRFRSRSRSYSRSRSPPPRRAGGGRSNDRRRSQSRDSYGSYDSRRSPSPSRDRGFRDGRGGGRGPR
ncbi:Serine/arginine-rich splicing factor SR45 [Colletotrichum trifolii]|uniref:Serine/arginine-rich splicing factor SR45 n=1 Tax=Colletotrichum trifolii TaxID=5466 RepID=A0A4R8RYD9_COLTR|nr:Serine/arginine-rich splicing factor SR45 [Colletotrichum trifolii]